MDRKELVQIGRELTHILMLSARTRTDVLTVFDGDVRGCAKEEKERKNVYGPTRIHLGISFSVSGYRVPPVNVNGPVDVLSMGKLFALPDVHKVHEANGFDLWVVFLLNNITCDFLAFLL
jgi:hypothetical protein